MIRASNISAAPPDFAISAAVAAGTGSPCAKSKRGVAVYDRATGRLWGVGYNAQPLPFECSGDELCRASCSQLCEHAEQVAIRSASVSMARSFLELRDLTGCDLVHAKVIDGKLVAGGGPSCWQCSRLVLGARLDGAWLFQRTWEECLSEDGCPYCSGLACAECEDTPGRGAHSPHHDRHYDLVEVAPRWCYRTAEGFHRETLRACGMEAQ